MKEFELTEENFAGCVDAATGKPIPKKGDVVLPEKVIYKGEECKLTGIKDGAFFWCKELTSVVIPDGVVSIGESTFYGCDALKSVKIPESVARIGAGALGECVSLTEIDIPDSVTAISYGAFAGCSSLEKIEIPDSVTSIEEGAFYGCTGLTHIEIPNRVTNIEDSIFEDCSSLSSVKIPDSVSAINYGAFAGCNSLEKIEIPGSVTRIEKNAFSGCNKLSSVVIPDGATDIEESTFQGCRKLHSVKIPDSMTRIGICAFAGCSSLEKIKIPDHVTEIQTYAFKDCVNLTSISIPDGVKNLDYGVLENCSGLKELHLPDDITFCDALNGCSDDLVINYRGLDITYKAFALAQEQSDGLEDQKCLDIAKDATDILGDGIYSPVLVSKLCNAEHGGKLEQIAAQNKKDFRTIGFYDIKNSADTKAKEELTALFQADRKSRGVVPKIIDALTIASTELHIPPEQIVKSFEEKKFRNAVMAMRSCNKGNRFCDVEAALFAMNFDVNMVKNVILENPNKDYASVLLCESYKKKDEHLLDLAKWVAYHPDVSQDLVKDIVKYRNGVSIDVSDNVDSVRARISRGRAVLEIQAIENAYLDFKFADCKCNLPKTEVELGDYKAYIMDAQDPRQVMIGYDTDCCQHLGGEGETAMMYGLVNPDAGFFVIEDKRSGKILAQAETWQTADGEKLVFDNIEFADDRKVNQFAPVLAKWCEKSPYPDILMGNGYNEMINDSIRQFEGMTPPLTRDLLVTLDNDNIVSSLENTYGEKYPSPCDLYEAIATGEVDISEEILLEDIIPYTDADKSCSALKCAGAVEPYFQEAYDNYVQEHGALPEIGSFFSEPSEEDLLTFPNKEESPEDTYVMVSGDLLENVKEASDEADLEMAGKSVGVEEYENDGYDETDDFEEL